MIILAVVVLALVLLLLQSLRFRDEYNDSAAWHRLARTAGQSAKVFEPTMVQKLPEPARRFFTFTIQPGTSLQTVTCIRMHGQIGLGTRASHRYLPMEAQQILAPPHGLLWRLRAGRGLMQITGSDGIDGETSWVRFWLARLVPVVRQGGNPDHRRAAFGRVVAEAIFWAPAAMLPSSAVSWEQVGDDVARATVRHNAMEQTVDVTVSKDGRPLSVELPRWSNANPDKVYQLQPFGGFLSEFRTFSGYRLPTCVEGGNFFGTEDYFPFYKARVDDVRFVEPGQR